MKNRIKRLFTANIGWKIAAVFIGIIIWAILSNTQDPITSSTVKVPITYLNENKLLRTEQLVFLRGPETVTINVDVRTSDIRKLNASLFTCTADLVDHSGGDLSSQRIHIDVTQVGGEGVILDWSYYRNDPNITVSMDEYIQKTFTVTLKQEGSLPEEMLFQNPPAFTPEKITVSGPKSRFANVQGVKAPVNLTNLSKQGAGNVELHDIVVNLYDGNDSVVSNSDGALKLSQETVDMTASIARIQSVTISLEDTTGTPAEGFRKVNTSLNRQVVDVRGLLGTLSSFDRIVIPAGLVNIDGISQDTEYTIDLAELLPQGVTVAEGSSIVIVTVTVEALVAKEYAYNTANITLTGEDDLYLYSFEADTVPLRVRGFQEDLDLLDVNASVAATANVSGLRPGTHTVKVAIEGPRGYYYDNADSISVRVNVKVNEAKTTTEEETTESESESESESGGLEESSGSETESESESESESDTESESESESDSESESESESEPEELQAEDGQ